ncbi:MAG: adenylosuccinate synthase [Planctomycetes bacterium]|nr:adenylosuccinate synthase [Planctomycetota bacterium]
MNENLLVVGLQWGDEGKGKIIDVLSDRFDAIVRFQGGANAGHTVQVGDETFILHLIPSGILRSEKLCVIGNGLVVDPECLLEEIEGLQERGIKIEGNLLVSNRAHLVMPYHKLLDGLNEKALGSKQIQTTRRGIGPCYSDKAARSGLRFVDLIHPEVFREKLSRALERKNRELQEVFGVEPLDFDELHEQYKNYGVKLRSYVVDTVPLMREMQQEGRSILFEGAQGTMLDINFGTYPYVTSSNVCAGGACVGSGIAPSGIDRVLGIVKAYCSRVGGGPFPTEQDNEIGETIRERGQEFGSTTGRPRRCGWLDGVALRHSVFINGAESIALMLMDVLSEFASLKICVDYEVGGERVKGFPADVETLQKAKPVYREYEGWQTDISDARTFSDLPSEANEYIAAVEEIAGTSVEMVSVGPERNQIARPSDNG